MGLVYKMHDSDQTKRGMIRINISEAKKANEEGYGIFQTVNSFRGSRKIINLISIDAWAVDIDTGTKDEQWSKIEQGLIPSVVVETKRGFQCWWRAIDAKPEYWNNMVLDRLVPFYGADRNARDIARVLRIPGYYHMKDPSDPFLVKKVIATKSAYSERDIARFYDDVSAPERNKFTSEGRRLISNSSTDLWDAIYHMDCTAGLQRLSGTDAIGGQLISFKNNTDGTIQIIVDGKGTSCWIDLNGRIGSSDKGGPTLWNWILWYQRDHSRTAKFMKQIFPELPWNKKSTI